MKKVLLTAATAAIAFAAAPASAQTAAPAVGARAELLVGYDVVRIDLEDFGIDDTESDSGLLYGLGLGYDFAVSSSMTAGFDVEVSDSTAEEGDEDSGQLSAGRDLYAGARVSFPVGTGANVYLKAGYTNFRLKAELGDEEEGENLDGVRLGIGAQFPISGKAYAGGEYRYSNYEANFTRHQFAAVLGMRF